MRTEGKVPTGHLPEWTPPTTDGCSEPLEPKNICSQVGGGAQLDLTVG